MSGDLENILLEHFIDIKWNPVKTSYNNKLQCFICFNDEIALELFDVTVCKTYLYILRNDGAMLDRWLWRVNVKGISYGPKHLFLQRK